MRLSGEGGCLRAGLATDRATPRRAPLISRQVDRFQDCLSVYTKRTVKNFLNVNEALPFECAEAFEALDICLEGNPPEEKAHAGGAGAGKGPS